MTTPKESEIVDIRPPCKYNYHDDTHEEVCFFEVMVDTYLVPDVELTIDAQKYRNELIEGIERMGAKLAEYKNNVSPLD